MTLFGFIVILILCGVGLAIVNLVPMDGTIKAIIKIICIAIICIAALAFLWGFLPPLFAGHPLTR